MLAAGCKSSDAPAVKASDLYAQAEQDFLTGQLNAALQKAQRGSAAFGLNDPAWAARFQLEEAKILLYQGRSAEAVKLLADPARSLQGAGSYPAERLILLSLSHARLGDTKQASQDLAAARAICNAGPTAPTPRVRAELSLAQGLLALEAERPREAQASFAQGLADARVASDTLLELRALLNLSALNLQQEHFEDAIEEAEEGATLARAAGANQALEKARGNIAWGYYKTGDFERAKTNFEDAAATALHLGATSDLAEWWNNAGLCEYQLGHFAEARAFFMKALSVAKSQHNDERSSDADVALASLLLHDHQLAAAAPYIEEARQLARQRNDTFDELPALLLEARLHAAQGDRATAQATLLDVERRAGAWPSFRWEAQHSLARLSEDAGDPRSAGRWFERSLATFRTQRSSLRSDDAKLPFFSNGRDLYLDYVDYLVARRKEAEALSAIDQARAETLAEGLKLASTLRAPRAEPTTSAQSLARRLHGTLLIYSLAPQHSYLWAVNDQRTALFRLPGKAEIVGLVARHQQAILSARDVAAEQEEAAHALYQTLVSPAQSMMPQSGAVFIVADEGLHGLNFETLLTPGEHGHYWIEDVTITNAASLRLLASSAAGSASVAASAAKTLMIVGDPVYAGQRFAPLPQAASEVKKVAAHFSPDARTLLTSEHASAAAYMSGRPEAFNYIHFVAHAVASEVTPLDSAVLLSANPAASGEAKLYARDILGKPLHAELVTLSACQGSGVRAYTGEGLVGLAWAFLRAGSRHVIGALWDVSDASTPQLMDTMYGELMRGSQPDAALRAAKLQMLHSPSVFRKPLYWGAFQLYAGGGAPPSSRAPAVRNKR